MENKYTEHIHECFDMFVEYCGIRHRSFAEIWFNCPKYFLHQDSDPAKFLRRECITLYIQFTNILEKCAKYSVTDEDLDYSFHLNDMKKFIDTYREFVEGQLTKPTFIL